MTWSRFKSLTFHDPSLELTIDLSRMNLDGGDLDGLAPRFDKAFADMAALEGGAIANPDEGRMVGHYWLRAHHLAPDPGIAAEIEAALSAVKDFTAKVHAGVICGSGGPFKNVLVIGIGGSALGPQFVAQALGEPRTDRMRGEAKDMMSPVTSPNASCGRKAPRKPASKRSVALMAGADGGTSERPQRNRPATKRLATNGPHSAKIAVVAAPRLNHPKAITPPPDTSAPPRDSATRPLLSPPPAPPCGSHARRPPTPSSAARRASC